MSKSNEELEAEVGRLREICMDIVDTINSDSRLFQEPIDYQGVLYKIEDLAFSGYAPKVTTE